MGGKGGGAGDVLVYLRDYRGSNGVVGFLVGILSRKNIWYEFKVKGVSFFFVFKFLEIMYNVF